MSKDIVNHPWGQSQDWSGEVKGYSSSRWLSGPPADSIIEFENNAGALGSSDDTLESNGTLAQEFPIPPVPAPVYADPASFNGQSETTLDNKVDYHKIVYTIAMLLMGIGSISVAVIQYKTYLDNKNRRQL
jgi:hypothetical protein